MYFFNGNAVVVKRCDQMASDKRYLEEVLRTIIDEHLSVLSITDPLAIISMVAKKSYALICFYPVRDFYTLYLKDLSVETFSFALIWLEMTHYNSRGREKLINKLYYQIQ